MKGNKEPGPVDRWMARVARHLRFHGPTVRDQILRGASYSLGSCAVSVAVFWLQNRH